MRCGRAGLSCRLTALSRRLPLTYTASFVVRREFQIETGHVGFQQQVDQRPGAEQPETQVNGAVFLLALEVHRFEVPESLFVAVHGAPISSGEVVAGHDLVHASAGIGAAQQGVYDRAVPVERRRNMARAAVEPCAQIVQHFMDQRTALVAQHEGVDRREQQLAPAGLAAEQYAAERLALPLAAEHLPGFDVLFLIVPFAPIRVAGVEQGGVGVAGGHHEAGNRLFGPFVEIERRKVLTVEQRVSAAYDVAGGIARSERHGVAAELFDQRKRRGRDVPYQQGASGAECGAEPFDEGRIFRRADAVVHSFPTRRSSDLILIEYSE